MLVFTQTKRESGGPAHHSLRWIAKQFNRKVFDVQGECIGLTKYALTSPSGHIRVPTYGDPRQVLSELSQSKGDDSFGEGNCKVLLEPNESEQSAKCI